MSAQDCAPPEPWKDEEAIEADLQTWLQVQNVEHDENMLHAFRIGWKAGAIHAVVSIWRWFSKSLNGHEEV